MGDRQEYHPIFMSKGHSYNDEQQRIATTDTSNDDDDDRRPPGGSGGVAVVSEENEDWELDSDKPWQATDFEERLTRAKEQAREMARIKPNYGTVGWSPTA